MCLNKNNEVVRGYIRENLNDIFLEAIYGFEAGELAYYSLQGKNELQIRDKFAWRLQNKLETEYPGQYIVRREWSPTSSGREKVDLAIIDRTNNPYVLIEFKANIILSDEAQKYAEKECYPDINKMLYMVNGMKANHNPDLYYIHLQSCRSKNNVNKNDDYTYTYPYAVAYATKKGIAYGDEKDRENRIIEYVKKHRNIFIHTKPKIKHPDWIEIGSSFECDIYIAPIIIGPMKKNIILKKSPKNQQ